MSDPDTTDDEPNDIIFKIKALTNIDTSRNQSPIPILDMRPVQTSAALPPANTMGASPAKGTHPRTTKTHLEMC